MSRSVLSALAVVLCGGLTVSIAQAQSRGNRDDPNPFGRYGDPEPKARGRSGSTSAPPKVAARPTPRGVHSYFPAMRTGQGPNMNVPAPTTHRCVLGRRGLMNR